MGVVVSCNYLLDTWLRPISAKDSHSGQKNILYYLYKGGVLQGPGFLTHSPGLAFLLCAAMHLVACLLHYIRPAQAPRP